MRTVTEIVDSLITRFGSVQDVADAAGVTKNAVTNWKLRGAISYRGQVKLIAAAQARGIWLTLDDFKISGERRPPERRRGRGRRKTSPAPLP